jgi:DNA-binding NarL/FixJ family response regulator
MGAIETVAVIDPQRLRGQATAAALSRLGLPAKETVDGADADVAILHEAAASTPAATQVLSDGDCRVLLLVPDHVDPRGALPGRCFGVLGCQISVEELAHAVRQARTGKPPKRFTPGEPSTDAQRAMARLSALSPRERDILTLLARAQRNEDIGRALGISANTVRTHVQNILGKLGVGSRIAAVALARQAGLDLVPEDQERP